MRSPGESSVISFGVNASDIGASLPVWLHLWPFPVRGGYSVNVFSRQRAYVPTFAARLERRTLTHSTMAAPELSMQLMRDWNYLSTFSSPLITTRKG